MTRSYTSHELRQIKTYKLQSKVSSANKRFDDKICLSDVVDLVFRFDFHCVYCNQALPPKTWQLDHFYSKAMGGKNKIDNLAPSCKWCNQMKGVLDGHSFLLKCKRVYEYNMIENKLGIFK